MSAYPLTIALPDGTHARVRIVHCVEEDGALTQLVSTPPQYERRDGTTVALDPTIPDDLCSSWFWFGSALVQDSGLVLISTASYPPPGLDDGRDTCFDCARRYEAQQRIQDARRAERLSLPQKKARKARPTPIMQAETAQAVMELV